MKLLLGPLVAAGLMLTGLAAAAGEVVDAATRAEELAAAGDYGNALEALAEARDTLWKQAPLSFRKALFVAADPKGFGVYEVRENAIFRRQDPLIVYAEPQGYGYGHDGDIFIIDLSLDFVITAADGQVIAEQKGFGALTMRSRVANKEFMAKVTYDFSALHPGDYEVTTRMKDKNSNKSGEFTLKFTLTE